MRLRREHARGRAAPEVTLHVHRDRVHGDMRMRQLDVDGEGGAVAAQPPCGPTPSWLTAADSTRSSSAPSGIVAAGAQRARGGAARARTHRSDVPRRRRRRRWWADRSCRRAAINAVHDEGLDGVDAFRRHGHLQERIVFEPLPFGIISMERRSGASSKSIWMTEDIEAARRMVVPARQRVHHGRSQRMFGAWRVRSPCGWPASVAWPSTWTLRPIDTL